MIPGRAVGVRHWVRLTSAATCELDDLNSAANLPAPSP